MKKTKVISGFPGVGKSTLTKNATDKVMLDSDSSQYSWLEPGVRHPDFPNNYMERIKENIGKVDYIFVSSHDVVREALEANRIPYTIVYPSKELKQEYIQRYIDRGNNDAFVRLLEEKYEEFIEGIEKETYPNRVPLMSGEYLADVMYLVDKVGKYDWLNGFKKSLKGTRFDVLYEALQDIKLRIGDGVLSNDEAYTEEQRLKGVAIMDEMKLQAEGKA